MINPLNSDHRARFARAIDFARTELVKYNQMRSNTVKAYLGVSDRVDTLGITGHRNRSYEDSLPQGNLLQMAGLSHQISLAYGEPEALCVARVPEHLGLSERLGPAINRMGKLLDLGETARAVAADSFFGYGIYKVGVGIMPPAAQIATGLREGPCVWRVGQSNFVYDIAADRWANVAYAGDIYPVSLSMALEVYPDKADLLNSVLEMGRFSDRNVMPRPSQQFTADETVWLIDVYFPASKLVATWVVQNDTLQSVQEEPLAVREYQGHWSGVYEVLNHLYSPDELAPIAQAESVKSLHYLFNDLFGALSRQSRNAKVNPVYLQGSERDMKKLWDAADRHPVGITSRDNLGLFEVPGPTQSQQGFLNNTFNLFKNLVPQVDEPQRAPTATQGALMRQTTNAIVGEYRRKFNRSLQLVYYKLGHLLMNNQDLVLPASRPILPGSNVPLDITWRSNDPEVNRVRIDDFDLSIEPYSTIYRAPEERLQTLFQLSQHAAQLLQLRAAGAPINIEEVFKTLGDYAGLPEFKNWFAEVDPQHQVKAAESRASTPRVGVGQYVRHNVSSRTTAGELEEGLGQAPDSMSEISTPMMSMD